MRAKRHTYNNYYWHTLAQWRWFHSDTACTITARLEHYESQPVLYESICDPLWEKVQFRANSRVGQVRDISYFLQKKQEQRPHFSPEEMVGVMETR